MLNAKQYSQLEKQSQTKSLIVQRPHKNIVPFAKLALNSFSQAFIQAPPKVLAQLNNIPINPALKSDVKNGGYLHGSLLCVQGRLYAAFDAFPLRNNHLIYYEIPVEDGQLQCDVIPSKVFDKHCVTANEAFIRKHATMSWWDSLCEKTKLSQSQMFGVLGGLVCDYLNNKCFSMKYDRPNVFELDGELRNYRAYLDRGSVDIPMYKATLGLCAGNLIFLKWPFLRQLGFRYIQVLAHEFCHFVVNQDIERGLISEEDIKDNRKEAGHGRAFFSHKPALAKLGLPLYRYAVMEHAAKSQLKALASIGGSSKVNYVFVEVAPDIYSVADGGDSASVFMAIQTLQKRGYRSIVLECSPFFEDLAKMVAVIGKATLLAVMEYPTTRVLADMAGNLAPDYGETDVVFTNEVS